MRWRLFSLITLSALVSLPCSAVLAQSFNSYDQPASPVPADNDVMQSDQSMLKVDQSRVDQLRKQEEQYKASMDQELYKDRQVEPSVEQQLAQMKRRFSGPTLSKLLSDPSSRYYVLDHWLQQVQSAEKQEKQTIGQFQTRIAQLQDERSADRTNIYADEQQAQDDARWYDRKNWSEQQLLSDWRYKHQDRLALLRGYGCGYGYGNGYLPGYGYGYGSGYGYGYGGYNGYGGGCYRRRWANYNW